MKPTQCDRILWYMQDFGSITQAEAMQNFGCYRLAARISDLKKLGYRIEKKTVTGKNRYGDPISWARYWLLKDD